MTDESPAPWRGGGRPAAVPDEELAALLAAAAGGDQGAFATLIRATQGEMRRFLVPLVNPADLEDLTQETFLRVFRALPSFAGRSTVRTWLFAIAKRAAADAVRQAQRRPRLVALTEQQSAGLADGVRFEEEHALHDLFAGLLPERREAFVITQIAGLSYAEAAEMCGCPIGTIRSRVARAREDLAAAVRDARPGRRRAG